MSLQEGGGGGGGGEGGRGDGWTHPRQGPEETLTSCLTGFSMNGNALVWF